MLSLALCQQVVSQAPHHFRSSETQPPCHGCFSRQSICQVVSLDSGMSRAVHRPESSKIMLLLLIIIIIGNSVLSKVQILSRSPCLSFSLCLCLCLSLSLCLCLCLSLSLCLSMPIRVIIAFRKGRYFYWDDDFAATNTMEDILTSYSGRRVTELFKKPIVEPYVNNTTNVAMSSSTSINPEICV